MSHADRAMMRRPVAVPFVDEAPRAAGETIAAVGVADFQNRPRHRLAFRSQQLELPVRRLDYAQQRDRPMLHAHLHRKPASYFAVKNFQRANFGFTLRDGDMSRT